MCTTFTSVHPQPRPIAALTIPARQMEDAFGYSVAAKWLREVVVGAPDMTTIRRPMQGGAYVYDLGSSRTALPGATYPSVDHADQPSPATRMPSSATTRVAFSGTGCVGAYGAVELRYDLVNHTSPSRGQKVIVATLTNPSKGNDFFGSSVPSRTPR